MKRVKRGLLRFEFKDTYKYSYTSYLPPTKRNKIDTKSNKIDRFLKTVTKLEKQEKKGLITNLHHSMNDEYGLIEYEVI